MKQIAIPSLLLIAATGFSVSQLPAQVIDEGVFSIRRDGKEIGREKFTISSGRGPDGKTAGVTISTVARYPSAAPTTTITAVLERSLTGQFTVFQAEYRAPGVDEQFLGAQDRGRITIHRFSADAREAREFPGGAGTYVMVDSLYALHHVLNDLATPEGATVTAYLARSGQRLRITAVRSGNTVQLTGGVEATLVLDATNRISQVEFPDGMIRIVRLSN